MRNRVRRLTSPWSGRLRAARFGAAQGRVRRQMETREKLEAEFEATAVTHAVIEGRSYPNPNLSKPSNGPLLMRFAIHFMSTWTQHQRIRDPMLGKCRNLIEGAYAEGSSPHHLGSR